MGVFLPIRAYNRSQKVRIGNQDVTATETTYIDVSDIKVRKDYTYHSALGAVIPVGDLRQNGKAFVVWSGCTVSEGVADTDRIITVAAGELRLEDGTYVAVSSQDLTVTNADASLDRVDAVVVDDSGTASIIKGTPSADPQNPDVGSDVLLAYVDVVAAGGADEVQQVTLTGATSGTFTLTFSTQTTAAIAYNAAATTGGSSVRAALEGLSNIDPGDVTVSGSAGGPYNVTFTGQYDEEDVAQMTADGTSLVGTNEVQTVTVDATGGTFTLTFSGKTTGDLAFDSLAADIQTALEGLSTIGSGNVGVTGGPGDAGGTTPYVVTFQGTLADTDVAQMTSDPAKLTGGASTATVATQTPGVTPSVSVSTTTPGVTVAITDSDITDARERA